MDAPSADVYFGGVNDTLARLRTALDGRYTIEREVGAGGMARVYEGQDLRHRRKVAIKVLRPELTEALVVSVQAPALASAIRGVASPDEPRVIVVIPSGVCHSERSAEGAKSRNRDSA
jgi:hypothetical protein